MSRSGGTITEDFFGHEVEMDGQLYTVDFNVTAKWYEDEGRTGGAPEDCYEGESDLEVTDILVTSCTVWKEFVEDGVEVVFSDPQLERLKSLLETDAVLAVLWDNRGKSNDYNGD